MVDRHVFSFRLSSDFVFQVQPIYLYTYNLWISLHALIDFIGYQSTAEYFPIIHRNRSAAVSNIDRENMPLCEYFEIDSVNMVRHFETFGVRGF